MSKIKFDEVHVCTECDADEPVENTRAEVSICPCCGTIEPSTRRMYQLSTGELVDDETLDALEDAERAAMDSRT